MTTAASFRSVKSEMAGAPGFEPGIAGPKPAALPLGYAPPQDSVTTCLEGSAPVRYEAAAVPAKPARPRLSAPQDDASALGYAPPQDGVTACLEGAAPVRYEAAAAPAKPAR